MKNIANKAYKTLLRSLVALCVVFLVLSLTLSCGGKKKDVIRIGATPVPHAEILQFAMPMFEKEGLRVEVVEFTDYVTPNLALADGDLYANFFQHVPYMESFASERGLSLASAGGVHVEPFALYSKKLKSLDDLKEGDQIGIPNDPSNGARALLLLQAHGLIELKAPSDLLATERDIVKNPKKLVFVAMDAAQLPRTLGDVAASTINTNFALEAGLNPEQALLIEGKASPYANILTVRTADKDSETTKKLMRVLQSQEIKDFLQKTYDGAIVPAF